MLSTYNVNVYQLNSSNDKPNFSSCKQLYILNTQCIIIKCSLTSNILSISTPEIQLQSFGEVATPFYIALRYGYFIGLHRDFLFYIYSMCMELVMYIYIANLYTKTIIILMLLYNCKSVMTAKLNLIIIMYMCNPMWIYHDHLS